MRIILWLGKALSALALFVGTSVAGAGETPTPKEAQWVIKDFKFHTGETLPELRVHYTTLGDPKGEPVLILHGTAQSGTAMLNPAFAGELFGPGQALDAARYYIILPDAIGAGKSAKPSDGLRSKFPAYNYDDMVEAQHRLVTEHLGVGHLRLVLGHSMGGMQTWIWAQNHPEAMDIAVPMASLPSAMSGRNWMLRRILTESIRHDPEWMGGNYTKQPRSLQFASVFFGAATNGGSQGLFKRAPTREQADAMLEASLTRPFPGDANDYLYQWESSRDYNPSAGLERIKATLLAINSTDDERNPPELGVLDSEVKRIRNGHVLMIPGGPDTFGHSTAFYAKFWKKDLADLLQSAPRRGK
ncbi:MAG: alpha/beta fold hydrolase [Massilia sp.]|nr:alpha/beta fold hydrolase [Massilia sp.]